MELPVIPLTRRTFAPPYGDVIETEGVEVIRLIGECAFLASGRQGCSRGLAPA